LKCVAVLMMVFSWSRVGRNPAAGGQGTTIGTIPNRKVACPKSALPGGWCRLSWCGARVRWFSAV